MSTDPSSHDQRKQTHTATPEESVDEQTNPDQVELTYETRETHVCLSCGTSVPQHVGRVYGDNQHNVRACERCWTDSNGYHSAPSHASAAMHARAEDRR